MQAVHCLCNMRERLACWQRKWSGPGTVDWALYHAYFGPAQYVVWCEGPQVMAMRALHFFNRPSIPLV